MVDLFMLWLLLLSLVLGPVGPKGVALDLVDPATGDVTTITGKATPDGFSFDAEEGGERRTVLVARRLAANGKSYALDLDGSEAGTFDLTAALAALQEGGDATRTFETEGKHVTVTGRGALRYVVVREAGEGSGRTVLCVRRPLD